MGISLSAQSTIGVPYQQQYNQSHYEMMGRSLREAQKRTDNNREYINNLIRWIGELKGEVSEGVFNNKMNYYNRKLNNMLTSGEDPSTSSFRNKIVQIENSIREEINNYNERLRQANDPNNIYQTGIKKVETGNVSGAVMDFKEVIKLVPDFSGGYFYLGYCNLVLNDYTEAVNNLTASIRIEPHASSYNYRGWAEYSLGNYVNAVRDFTSQIKMSEKDDPEGYFNRALAKSELGDFSGAIQDNKKAIEIYEDFSMAYNNLGWTYFERNELDKALKYINIAIEKDANNFVAYDSRAEIKLNQNNYKGAIEDCKTAIQIDPYYANSFFIMGIAYYKLGETSKACENWSKAGQYGIDDAYEQISKNCN